VNEYVLSARRPGDSRIAVVHNVVPGDSLGAIAKHYGTTVDAIRYINDFKGDVIRPGRSFKVLNHPLAVYVEKREFTLWVTYGGRVLLVMDCGIGKENRTPTGEFRINERIKNPVWYPADGPSVPPGDPRNLLGSRWLGFEDRPKRTGLGIHEATDPSDIRSEASNGCIRLSRADVELLFDLVPYNTPVTITE
jgi:lipoprotein-anchoring transpeptidase ErfK/SrfK